MPLNGDLNFINDSIYYTPDSTFINVDHFQYVITDNNLGFDTANVSIYTVMEINYPPVANDDYAFTVKNQMVTIQVLDNDTDPENDPLEVTEIYIDPSFGFAYIINSDSILYNPNPDFTGNDFFVYIITDSNNGYDTATVDVTVDLGIGIMQLNTDRILVYPNPVGEYVNILLPINISGDVHYSIYDHLLGKISDGFFENNSNSNYHKISLQGFPNGVLLLQLKGDKINKTIKLIKLQ